MIEYEFTAEVSSPLFMGGANARTSPEIRGQSIRGLMRYWYRALISGTNSSLVQTGVSKETNVKSVKATDDDIFGSTDESSKFSILVKGDWKNQTAKFQKDRALRSPNGDYLPTGKDYLLWSMAESGRPGTNRFLPAREYIKPGTQFKIILRSRLNSNAIKQATASLWLLANFGSFGSRSNRGAGSFQILSTNNEEITPQFKLCNSIEKLEEYLRVGIATCQKMISDSEEISWVKFSENSAPFDIISPSSAEFWVVAGTPDGWDTYLDALNALGGTLRNFRSHSRPNSPGKADHDAVLRWLSVDGSEAPDIKRAVFGLPIPFRYSEGGPNDVIQSEISDRRTSPLRIRITKLSTGKFVGVMSLFKSSFLEGDAKLQLQTRKWLAPPPPDYQIIQQFITAFPAKVKVAL